MLKTKTVTSNNDAIAKQKKSNFVLQPYSKLKLIAQILVFQLMAILVVEFALFLAGLGEEEIFRLDPELGFVHMPNKRVTWRSEGFATSYFNEEGLREPCAKIAKPQDVYRVAVLGDSLAESLQVPVETSFSFKLAEKLSLKLGQKVEVFNFGTSGYSTTQEYIQLKKQVLKYKPDLVLLAYNSRDCFENWSPPDEVLTNVRPAALQLPGASLLVDSSPVRSWLKTPRAKFLQNFAWFREHSRIWGLLSANELEWSMHNDFYKRVVLFLTRPGKAFRISFEELQDAYTKKTDELSFSIRKAKKIKAEESVSSDNKLAKNASENVSNKISGDLSKQTKIIKNVNSENKQKNRAENVKELKPTAYEQVIANTLSSLLCEMQLTCTESGAKFAVIAMPVRSALYAKQGLETSFNNFDYADEVRMLKNISFAKNIRLINVQEKACTLSSQDKDYLFYLVHLTPFGHKYLVETLQDELMSIITAK